MSAEQSTLAIHLALLGPMLNDPGITEIVVNRPGAYLVERQGGRWEQHALAALTFDWCMDLAKLLQNRASQSVSEASPLLGAQLPDGQRVQLVLPPAVPAGTVSITIRRPSSRVLTMAELFAGGAFEATRCRQSVLLAGDERARREAELGAREQALLTMFRARDWPAFWPAAVKYRRNIVASGATGHGKTTLGAALATLLGADERIVTVEDVPELRLGGANVVSLFYPKGGNGVSTAGPRQLLEAALRMRPDRVLLTELRGDETFFFIQNVLNSGHPGTITTVHATSAKGAFHRLALMIKASPEGGSIELDAILGTLYGLVDVVAQMERLDDGRRVVAEVYFDPAFAGQHHG